MTLILTWSDLFYYRGPFTITAQEHYFTMSPTLTTRTTRFSSRITSSPSHPLSSSTQNSKPQRKSSSSDQTPHVSRYDYHARLRQKIEAELQSGCLPYQALPGLNKVINMATLTPFEQEFFLMLAPTPLQDPFVLQKAVTGKQEKKVYRPRRKRVVEMEKRAREREARRNEEAQQVIAGSDVRSPESVDCMNAEPVGWVN